MERARKECEPLYHRFFAMEPMIEENTGKVTIVLVCTNCGKPIRYDFNVNNRERIEISE